MVVEVDVLENLEEVDVPQKVESTDEDDDCEGLRSEEASCYTSANGCFIYTLFTPQCYLLV